MGLQSYNDAGNQMKCPRKTRALPKDRQEMLRNNRKPT